MDEKKVTNPDPDVVRYRVDDDMGDYIVVTGTRGGGVSVGRTNGAAWLFDTAAADRLALRILMAVEYALGGGKP